MSNNTTSGIRRTYFESPWWWQKCACAGVKVRMTQKEFAMKIKTVEMSEIFLLQLCSPHTHTQCNEKQMHTYNKQVHRSCFGIHLEIKLFDLLRASERENVFKRLVPDGLKASSSSSPRVS